MYPRYHLNSRWLQVKELDTEYSDWQVEGAPEGLFWNGSSWDTMFKEVIRHQLHDSARAHQIQIREKYPVEGEISVVTKTTSLLTLTYPV